MDTGAAPLWSCSAAKIYSKSYFRPSAVVKNAAYVRNLRVEWLGSAYFVVSDDNRSVEFWGHTPQTTSLVARRVSVSKPLTKRLLDRAGVRVPAGSDFAWHGVEEGWTFAERIGLPVVVKPTQLSGGSGVTADIGSEEHFRLAWEAALQASSKTRVIVEKHIHGRDYRLYVVGGRVAAVVRRICAYVTGDGVSSVAELVAAKSKARLQNPFIGRRAMRLTPMMVRNLQQLGLTADSVLEQDRTVTLHPVANVGAGGESVDVTADVHPDFHRIALEAAAVFPNAINIGVDLLVDDITAPAAGQAWAICEINTCPDIALHHFPVEGAARDVAGALVEHLLPGSRALDRCEHRATQVVVTGEVAATGYRQWVWRHAHLRGLSGWVRNTPSSEVEALFCGAPNAVDDMLRTCRNGPRRATVTDVVARPCAPPGAEGFEVRS